MTVQSSVALNDTRVCGTNAAATNRLAYGSTSMGLINNVRALDVDAWTQFVRLYTPLVYYWCRSAGVSRADAEDVNQEVFVAVARAIPSFRRDRETDTFRGWLRTVCRNKVLDYFRRRQKLIAAEGGTWHHQRMTEVVGAFDPASAVSTTLSMPTDAPLQAVAAFVRNEFSETSWRAFWRTAVDGQPASAVAGELGMSHAAVRKAKSRVLRRLREELTSPLEDHLATRARANPPKS